MGYTPQRNQTAQLVRAGSGNDPTSPEPVLRPGGPRRAGPVAAVTAPRGDDARDQEAGARDQEAAGTRERGNAHRDRRPRAENLVITRSLAVRASARVSPRGARATTRPTPARRPKIDEKADQGL
ncbi:hypothetical protein CgIS1_08350 [Frankia sp. CgS1]|nr:hypothetical protein CgIS1_08350 [Frankia sp. CgIS1]